MGKSNLNSQSGALLIEIIITIFLVAILFQLIFMEVSILAVARSQRYENIAYHVANKQMEALKTTPVDSLASSGTISDSSLNQIPSGSGSFTVSSYSGYSGIKQVTVTVSWQDGSTKSVVLDSLVGSGGITP